MPADRFTVLGLYLLSTVNLQVQEYEDDTVFTYTVVVESLPLSHWNSVLIPPLGQYLLVFLRVTFVRRSLGETSYSHSFYVLPYTQIRGFGLTTAYLSPTGNTLGLICYSSDSLSRSDVHTLFYPEFRVAPWRFRHRLGTSPHPKTTVYPHKETVATP
jgi:hypothetical protein